MDEIWKYTHDSQNYQVSNLGNFKSLSRVVIARGNKRKISGKLFSCSPGKNGYVSVQICVGSRKSKVKKYLHRLVAESFIPNPSNLPEVNHIDGDKLNNSAENLEWVSARENMSHFALSRKKTSKYVGVSYCKASNNWKASIKICKKVITLGGFENEYEAYLSRIEKMKELEINDKYAILRNPKKISRCEEV